MPIQSLPHGIDLLCLVCSSSFVGPQTALAQPEGGLCPADQDDGQYAYDIEVPTVGLAPAFQRSKLFLQPTLIGIQAFSSSDVGLFVASPEVAFLHMLGGECSRSPRYRAVAPKAASQIDLQLPGTVGQET